MNLDDIKNLKKIKAQFNISDDDFINLFKLFSEINDLGFFSIKKEKLKSEAIKIKKNYNIGFLDYGRISLLLEKADLNTIKNLDSLMSKLEAEEKAKTEAEEKAKIEAEEIKKQQEQEENQARLTAEKKAEEIEEREIPEVKAQVETERKKEEIKTKQESKITENSNNNLKQENMKKWEYTSRQWKKVYNEQTLKMQDQGLNLMGKKGWELVSKTEHQGEIKAGGMTINNSYIVWVFKRPMK